MARQSIASVAEGLRGQVGDFRRVLDINPGSLPFDMPPQVQMGIDLLESFGVEVPSLESLMSGAAEEQEAVDKALKNADGVLGDAIGILQKLDWLH
jgi:hypothetical protein